MIVFDTHSNEYADFIKSKVAIVQQKLAPFCDNIRYDDACYPVGISADIKCGCCKVTINAREDMKHHGWSFTIWRNKLAKWEMEFGFGSFDDTIDGLIEKLT